MGRTLPSASQVLIHEEAAFGRFRRALVRPDQLALDELFRYAHLHTAEVQYAAHALPFEAYLLVMVLEEHKVVMKLRDQIEALLATQKKDGNESRSGSASQSTMPGFVDPGVGIDDNPNTGEGEE